MKHNPWWALAAIAVLPVLQACGGNGSSSGDSAVRLVNAGTSSSGTAAALDFYATDSLLESAVAADTAGNYVALSAGTYTMALKNEGSSASAYSGSRSVASNGVYTLVAYNTGEALKTALLDDSETAPTSGNAKLRVFNTSTEAGSVDVYVTAPDAALDDSAAATTSLAGEHVAGYGEFSASSYRIRVTGAGDKTDLRLDIPSIALADQQVATLILTSTPGGVLVHGLLLNQQSTLTPYKNSSARVRLVASVADKATVAAVVNGSTLASGLNSPAVGSYTLVDAGDLSLAIKVNGTAIAASGTALAAGSDTTLLVTGSADAAALTQIADDNRPPLNTSNVKLRLVHGVSGLASSITLTADYSAVASDVAPNTASTPASIAASTTFRLEATSPAVTGSMYLETDVSLQAPRVYTLFMLGDAATPLGVLRRDR